MIEYAFQLGSNSALSFVEIAVRCAPYSPQKRGDFAYITVDDEISDPQALLDSLGGSIRLIESMPTKRCSSWHEALEKLTIRDIEPFLPLHDKKLTFGISIFSSDSVALRAKRYIFARSIQFKRELTGLGKKVRVVNSRDNLHALPSATVYQNDMTTNGLEICLIENSEGIFIGKTVGVQDLDAYRERDEERPLRDPVRGMMPVKLAQILLNLTGLPAKSKILDPFCGLGTTLQEGMLRDYQMYGSDNDQVALKGAEKNLAWFTEHFSSYKTYELRLGDATALPRIWQGLTFQGVVTEGYLGVPLSHTPTDKEVSRASSTIKPLISQFLASCRAILVPQAPVILTLPYFPERGEEGFIFSLDTLHELGYTDHTLLAPLGAAGLMSARKTLLYARPDAHVGREVVLLENKE